MNTGIINYFHEIIRSDYFNKGMAKVHKTSCLERLSKPFSLIIIFLFIGLGNGFAQFWTEEFGTGNCSNQGQIADGHVTANGTWTVVTEGPSMPFANV